jgi:hypothetical protein
VGEVGHLDTKFCAVEILLMALLRSHAELAQSHIRRQAQVLAAAYQTIRF